MPSTATRSNRSATLVAASLALIAVLAASACQSDDGAYTPADASQEADTGQFPGTGTPPPEYSAVPLIEGQIDDAVAEVPNMVERAMAETGVPGIGVAIVHDGEVVFAEGYGVRDVNTGEKVDADTAFQLASLSKSVGATVISEEVSAGTIAWDDPIVDNLPGFELSDPYVTENVSYADLYSHRSGLPSHIGDTLEDLGYDRGEVLDRLRYVPLDAFRAENHYTNFGLTAAGQAAANAAGTSWEDLSAEALYTPLGMSSTTSSYDQFVTQDNIAKLHVEVDGTWEQLNTRDADAQSPAGGVSSSVNDMAAWMEFVLGEGNWDGQQLIDAETFAEMMRPHSQASAPGSISSRPGLDAVGFNTGTHQTGRVTFSHSGAFAMGAGTNFVLVPSADLGIVVLTNGSPVGVAEAIGAEFVDLATTGTVSQDWLPMFQSLFVPLLTNPASLADVPAPANPAPALADDAYTGTYANAYYGDAEIVVEGGELFILLGPDATPYPLEHRDGNDFIWTAPGENSPGPSLVSFTVGDGQATSINVVALNEVPPLGVFTR